MSRGFGPWSSSLGGEGSPRLSTFWRRRMSHLPRAYAARPGVSRREWLQLTAAGAAACALPTPRGKPPVRPIYVSRIAALPDWRHAGRYEILAVDPKTGKVEARPDPIGGSWPVVSPDGSTLALVRSGGPDALGVRDGVGVWAFDFQGTGPPRRVADFFGATAWSPDGRRLIVVKSVGLSGPRLARREAWLFDLDGSEPARLPVPETDEVCDWSPDGRRLVAVAHRLEGREEDGSIALMRPDGTERRRLAEAGGGNLFPRFSPDGRRLAYLHKDPATTRLHIRVSDLDGGPSRVLVQGTPGHLVSPDRIAWSPDGGMIAFIESLDLEGDRGRPSLVDVESKEVRTLELPAPTFLLAMDWR